MKIFKTIISAASVVGMLFVSSASGSAATSEVGSQAEEDVAMGMMGLKHAASDPELLAQLMADMKDPEMMAKAKKMMEDPSFQSEIKFLQNTKEFKEGLKRTKEALDDPSTAAKLQAQMEHMLKVGQDQMAKKAGGAVKEAMDMMNDPEVFAEAMKMMKDPNFMKQLDAFMKDPAFSSYREAMEDMMNDPEQKVKFEAMAAAMKGSAKAEL